MFSIPRREEIDHHTMKLIVGLIAISLAALTSIFSGGAIDSISASYHQGGWGRDVFVGSLFAISGFVTLFISAPAIRAIYKQFGVQAFMQYAVSR